MRKLCLIAILFLVSITTHAQVNSPTARRIVGTTVSPTTCLYSVSAPSVVIYNGDLYLGGVGNTCLKVASGGGSGAVASIGLTGTASQITVTGSTPITTSGSWALSLSPTIALGTDNSVAGTLQMASTAAAAHTILGSVATTSNTFNFPATVPTTGHLLDCTTTSTTCVIHDSGLATSAVLTTGSTLTLASSMFANQGTVTTVLHGNASGNPAFGAVVTADLNITTTSCSNQFVRGITSGAGGTCSSIVTVDLTTAANTRTVTFSDLSPVTGDDGLIVLLNPATAIHITRFSCGVTGTTSVVANIVKATLGLVADTTCTAGDVNQVVVTTFDNTGARCGGTTSCAVAAHAPVTLHIGTISGTPTSLSGSIDYTVD